MSGWMYRSEWWEGPFLLFLGWVLYVVFRPVKDFYVVQRVWFHVLFKEPWRGEMPVRGKQDGVAMYYGFDDYLAAKAVFDGYENEYFSFVSQMNPWIEVENRLFRVPATNKALAITRLKWKKNPDYSRGWLLHKTSKDHIQTWRQAAKELHHGNVDTELVQNSLLRAVQDEVSKEVRST